MFEKASRAKLRFNTVQGQLSVEDLWFIPLKSTRSNVANLNSIAVELDKELKDTTVSFVDVVETKENAETKLKFDLVKHIISVRLAEAKEEATKKDKAEKRRKIMELMERKQDEKLESSTVEDLQKMLDDLG